MGKKLIDRMRNEIEEAGSAIESLNYLTANLKQVSSNSILIQMRDNEFRHHQFKFKPGMKLKKIDSSDRIPFFGLAAMLRNYVIGNDLLTEDFNIHCDTTLKTITHKDETSFFDIARSFTAILE